MNLYIFLMQNEKNRKWKRNEERKKKKERKRRKGDKVSEKLETHHQHIPLYNHNRGYYFDERWEKECAHFEMENSGCSAAFPSPTSFFPYILFFFFTWKIRWYDLHRLKGTHSTPSIEPAHIIVMHKKMSLNEVESIFLEAIVNQ